MLSKDRAGKNAAIKFPATGMLLPVEKAF